MNPKFEGVPLAALQRTCGALEGGATLPIKDDVDVPVGAIPAFFDSRQGARAAAWFCVSPAAEWAGCQYVSEIRDQGACGSDWAVAAAAAITDRICIASNGTSQPHISAEDLTACCTSCGYGKYRTRACVDPTTLRLGCDGGYTNNAWQWYQYEGIVTGGNFGSHQARGVAYRQRVSRPQGCSPYTIPPCDHHVEGQYPNCSATLPPTPTCNKTCEPGYPTPYSVRHSHMTGVAHGAQADRHFGESAYNVAKNVAKIQFEIMLNGPVEALFTVYSDFFSYKSGLCPGASAAADRRRRVQPPARHGRRLARHQDDRLGLDERPGLLVRAAEDLQPVTAAQDPRQLVEHGLGHERHRALPARRQQRAPRASFTSPFTCCTQCNIEGAIVAGLPKA